MKRDAIVIFAAFLGVWVVITVGFYKQSVPHIYQLDDSPDMLSDDLAIEKARDYFSKQGYNMEKWRLIHTDSPVSVAPDGTPDRFLDRSEYDSNVGFVYFANERNYVRTVSVKLENDQIVCEMARKK